MITIIVKPHLSPHFGINNKLVKTSQQTTLQNTLFVSCIALWAYLSPVYAMQPLTSENLESEIDNPTTASSSTPKMTSIDIPKGRKRSLSSFQILDQQDPLNFDWKIIPETVCNGRYITPEFNITKSTPDYNEAPTSITYDEGELFGIGKSTLSGNVEISQPQFRIFADKVHIFRNEQGDVTTSEAYGNVLLEQPMTRIMSQNAQINLTDKSGTLGDSYYRLYESHGRGHAERVERLSNGSIKFYNANYTVCPPADNTWRLQAREVTINKDKGRGKARDAKLYLKDWPVLYSPYLSFPITDERKSGFLTPNYEKSNLRGEEFILPFYFNMAPNYDFTLTSHYMSKRNMLEEGQFRYLFSKAQGSIYVAGVPNDYEWQNYQDNTVEFNPRQLEPDDIRLKDLEDASTFRRALSFTNNSVINRYTQSNATFNYVSDSNYLVDFVVPDLDSNNRQLLRQITTIVEMPVWSFAARLVDYQVLQPYEGTISADPYQILPQLVAKADIPNGELGLDYQLYSEMTYFNNGDDPVTNQSVTVGSRVDFSPAVDLPLRNSFAYFVPRAEFRVTQYNLSLGEVEEDLANKSSNDTRTIPLFDIDAGLLFDRNFTLLNQNYTQTLEPRLFYLYVPYKNQNNLPVFDSGMEDLQFTELFYVNRFSGRDRVGDANQLTYAMVSRFQEWQTGIERARISVGQTVYFRDRLVTLCDSSVDPDCLPIENPNWNEPISPIVAQLDYALNQLWYVTTQAQWNIHDKGRLDQGGIWLSYRESNDYMIDFGYRYIWQGNPVGKPVGNSANNLEQLLTAVSYRLNPRWHLLGGWQFDVINHLTIDTFGGIEYENCCWATRLGARRQLTVNSSYQTDEHFDSSFYIQFVFKGLAAIGTDPGPLFTERIIGYEDMFGKRY
jgi:LPS-assembly protein